MQKWIYIYVDTFERNCKIVRFEKLKFFFIDAKKSDENFFVSALFLSRNPFSEKAFDINCKLKNKENIKTFALLNTDNSKIVFIDIEFAQQICNKLNISFQKLVKVKFIRDYKEKANIFIPHVIYAIMIVNKHRKNSTSLLITKLKNHKLILGKILNEKTWNFNKHDQYFVDISIKSLRSFRC